MSEEQVMAELKIAIQVVRCTRFLMVDNLDYESACVMRDAEALLGTRMRGYEEQIRREKKATH